jgi:hypothetical protein
MPPQRWVVVRRRDDDPWGHIVHRELVTERAAVDEVVARVADAVQRGALAVDPQPGRDG